MKKFIKVKYLLLIFFISISCLASEARLTSSKHKKIRSSNSQYKRTKKLSFQIPIIYNEKVRRWIYYFQTKKRDWFLSRLTLSYYFKPDIEQILRLKKLPRELLYLSMIESGFSAQAVSPANAVGLWQFIKPTAQRYGLKTNWWVDERKHVNKSTWAALNYLGDLHKMFKSWYLAAAAYNMGENKLKRLIKKYNTKDFWILSKKYDFPKETREYIPKLIAAAIIAKSPKLYGFHNIPRLPSKNYRVVTVPGGTDLANMAQVMGLKSNYLKKINPELILGFVPIHVKRYNIKVPAEKATHLARYIRALDKL